MKLNEYWKISMYFVLFEFVFWVTSKRFSQLIYNILFDFSKNQLLYDLSNYEVYISFVGILISLWCFKQFIKYFAEELKRKNENI